jgi:hypothetical protein
MKTKEILTIIAISSMGLSLICSLVGMVMKKGNGTYGKACNTFIFLSIVLLTVSQFVRGESERYSDTSNPPVTSTVPTMKDNTLVGLTIKDGIISYKVDGDTLTCDTNNTNTVINGIVSTNCKIKGIKWGDSWEDACKALYNAGKDKWGWNGECVTDTAYGESLRVQCKDTVFGGHIISNCKTCNLTSPQCLTWDNLPYYHCSSGCQEQCDKDQFCWDWHDKQCGADVTCPPTTMSS